MTKRRTSILREMGLAPVWRLREAGRAADNGVSIQQEVPVVAGLPQSANAALSPPQQAPVPCPETIPGDSMPDTVLRSGNPIEALGWDELENEIRLCRHCRLCEQRKQAVPGVGDRQADWLFVGEGPGAEEDRRGEPFVGPAGKLLDAMLQAIGLRRSEGVYIANSVKCRPPFNRTPQSDEIAACLPYLHRQIQLLQPKIIVALGRPAAQSLLNAEIKISGARGRVFHCGDKPVIVTYHPAYLLRNPADKRKAWEDLCFARSVVSSTV